MSGADQSPGDLLLNAIRGELQSSTMPATVGDVARVYAGLALMLDAVLELTNLSMRGATGRISADDIEKAQAVMAKLTLEVGNAVVELHERVKATP